MRSKGGGYLAGTAHHISCGSFFLFHFDRVMENSCVLLLSSAVIIPVPPQPQDLLFHEAASNIINVTVRDKLVRVFDPLLNARTSNVSDFVFDCHKMCRGKSYSLIFVCLSMYNILGHPYEVVKEDTMINQPYFIRLITLS